MRLGRKRGNRAHRARFPFARFITRCHLPCLKRYADSDTNSDIQCDSLLFGQSTWGQHFGAPDSDEETNLLEDDNEELEDPTPCRDAVDIHPPPGGASNLTSPLTPNTQLLPPSAATASQPLVQSPPDANISLSAPTLAVNTEASGGAASGDQSPKLSGVVGESRPASGSMGDVRFGLHNRFRLPLSQQYHCWQNMFGQHRNSGLPHREPPPSPGIAAAEGQQMSNGRSPLSQRSRSSSVSDSASQGAGADGGATGETHQEQSNVWAQSSRLSPGASGPNFTSRVPSRSSWIMDLPLVPSVTPTPQSTLSSNHGNPFLLRPTQWHRPSDTLQSRASTSSDSSINQSLFDPLSMPRTNPFADLAWPTEVTPTGNNWSLSAPNSADRVQGRTGVVDSNSLALTLQDNNHLNTESSTDPPFQNSLDESLQNCSTDVTDLSVLSSESGLSHGDEGHSNSQGHDQSQGHSEGHSQSLIETNQSQDLPNPLGYLFQAPETVRTDTLGSSSTGTSSSVSARHVDTDSVAHIESLLTPRDTLAMLFDARSRTNSSHSSSNTSSLARPGSDPLQDWYFYDPRMAPGNRRGHLMQGLLSLPEVISPPAYDEIVNQNPVPPYVSEFGSHLLDTMDPLMFPQEPPPPYPGSLLESPPPYERGSNWSSTQEDCSSLSSYSSSAFIIPQDTPTQPLSEQTQSHDHQIPANQSAENGSPDSASDSQQSVVRPQRVSMGLFGGRPPVRWNGGMRVDRWASTRSPNWLIH